MNLDESCHFADLCGFQWHGSLDVDPIFIQVLEISWKYVPTRPLDESLMNLLQEINASEKEHFPFNCE